MAWLAQQMAFAPITRLLRIGWATVGRIVERVVADHLDEDRLAGLVCIGVDEISAAACSAPPTTGAPGRLRR